MRGVFLPNRMALFELTSMECPASYRLKKHAYYSKMQFLGGLRPSQGKAKPCASRHAERSRRIRSLCRTFRSHGEIQKGRAPFGRLNEGSPEGGEIRNLPPLACLCILSARTERMTYGKDADSFAPSTVRRARQNDRKGNASVAAHM